MTQRFCRRRGCNVAVTAACSTGYCPNHCRGRQCTCNSATVDMPGPRPYLCRHSECSNAVAACGGGFCQSHCRCRACGRVDLAVQPRRRVCRNANCWVIVAPDCVTGYCREHCNSARCSCSQSPSPLQDASRLRRCRRGGCQAPVEVVCRTGYCRAHCYGRNCCNSTPQSNSNGAFGPLQRYLSDMCANLPVDVVSLPAQIRDSFNCLRSYASADRSGNGRGSRRRQRGESRAS